MIEEGRFEDIMIYYDADDRSVEKFLDLLGINTEHYAYETRNINHDKVVFLVDNTKCMMDFWSASDNHGQCLYSQTVHSMSDVQHERLFNLIDQPRTFCIAIDDYVEE